MLGENFEHPSIEVIISGLLPTWVLNEVLFNKNKVIKIVNSLCDSLQKSWKEDLRSPTVVDRSDVSRSANLRSTTTEGFGV